MVFVFGLGLLATKFLQIDSERLKGVLVLAFPALICYSRVSDPKPYFWALVLLFSLGRTFYENPKGKVLVSMRNYFGVLSVYRDPSNKFYQLVHGNTVHGRQYIEGVDRLEPILYYRKKGPVDEIMKGLPESNTSHQVAVVGLGAGALHCHAKDSEEWDYYEIDPGVEQLALATPYFSFLRECTKAVPKVIRGDARLQILKAPAKNYRAIIIDAFSSDAIPQHLLTREALRVYLEKLSEDGALIFHISNRYLNLKPVLGNLAKDLGLIGKYTLDDLQGVSNTEAYFASSWAVLARSEKAIAQNTAKWNFLPTSDQKVWTDDYSSLFSALNWGELDQ
jgi:spermidine synthase